MTAMLVKDIERSREPRPRYSAFSVFRAVVGTILAAWILSFAYSPLEHWSPIVYLNIVLAYAYGWAVGAIGRGFLRRNRINSKGAAALIGGLGGLFAIWFAWAAYIWVLVGYDVEFYTEVVADPAGVWHFLQFLAHNPIWSIRSSAAAWPFFYYAVWALEILCIAGMAVSTCLSMIKENRLCERCNDWIAKTEDTAVFELPEAPEALLAALADGDVSGLPGLRRIGDEDEISTPQWLSVQGHACPNCTDAPCHVTVALGTAKKGKGDQVEVQHKNIVSLVPVDAATETALFEEPADHIEDDAERDIPAEPMGDTEPEEEEEEGVGEP